MQLSEINRIQEIMKQMNLDGWLLYDFRGSNDLALSVLRIPSEKIASRRIFYLIPQSGSPVKIVNAIESGNLDHLPGEKLIYASHNSLKDALSRVLKVGQNVAMEYSPNNNIPYISKVDAGSIEQIRALGVGVKSSADLITMFTSVWTENQLIDNLPVAKGLTKIVAETCNFIRDKKLDSLTLNEYEVQQHIFSEIETTNKWIAGHPPIVAVNKNSANPHYAPTVDCHTEIKFGDCVLMDLWAKVNKPEGVWGDITWVAFMGETVPQKFNDIFNIVAAARDSAFDFVCKRFTEGREIRGYEVDDAARKVINDAGYGDYFVHRTGHSITTEGHGSGAHMDNFESHDERLILPGNSFSIEPGIYLPGEFGIRSEIDVYVYPDGRVISTGEIQREIIPIMGSSLIGRDTP